MEITILDFSIQHVSAVPQKGANNRDTFLRISLVAKLTARHERHHT